MVHIRRTIEPFDLPGSTTPVENQEETTEKTEEGLRPSFSTHISPGRAGTNMGHPSRGEVAG